MFEWLRKNLYIHTILAGNIDAVNRMREMKQSIEQLQRQMTINNLAIARLLGKLDPTFGQPENDPARQKESDEIANRAIKQLYAEQMARQPASSLPVQDLITQSNRIAEDSTNDVLLQQIKEMADTIRNMDQLIWHMSQSGTWTHMQPYFAQLMEGVEARKKNESNRITNILRKELIKTYAPKLENKS